MKKNILPEGYVTYVIVEIFSIHHCDITSKILRGARMFKQHIRTRKICRMCFEKVALTSNEVHKKVVRMKQRSFYVSDAFDIPSV